MADLEDWCVLCGDRECGGDCDDEWGEEYADEPPSRPVETVDTGGLL